MQLTPAQKISRYISTLGPVGFIPFAPGTMGTLVAVLFVLFLSPSSYVLLIIAVLSSAVGTWASGIAEGTFGSKDPSQIIIDEFAGYMVSMLFIPITVKYIIVSFILFRIFDIFKPPPLKSVQSLKGGAGIMIDDILAGLYTNIIIQLWIRST